MYNTNIKIAFFNQDSHPINLKRQILLANKLGFKVLEWGTFYNQLRAAGEILITDDIEIRPLFKIFVKLIFYRRFKVNIIFLELYFIEFKALVNEFTSSTSLQKGKRSNFFRQGYYTYFRLIKFVFFRLILWIQQARLFIPSIPRIEYLNKIFRKKHEMVLLRNLPLFSDWENENINIKDDFIKSIIKSDFLFIAGNIYNLNDFYLVCKFAIRNEIPLVITSPAKIILPEIYMRSPFIIQTGRLAYQDIIALTKKSLAGIAVFSKYNINQNYAASSKVYEFLAHNKPLLASKVLGVMYEVESINAETVFYIEDLDDFQVKDLKQVQTTFNYELSFENEVSKLQYLAN